MKPRISVLVCSYNRVRLLRECLASLEKQSADRNLFEVVIVDNNSNDGTSDLAAEFVARNSHFRALVESNQGISFARNRGMVEATGDWVAYIDDDARAFPDYIEKMLSFIDEQPDAGCFGGPCVPLYHESKPSWYLDEYQTGFPTVFPVGVADAPRSVVLPTTEFAIGFNIVFNRAALLASGGFNNRIGMRGRKTAYGEETLVQIRIRRAGHKVYFVSDLLVYHYIDSYKLHLGWIFKSNYANGRDSWETFEHTPTLKERLGNLNYAARYPLRHLPDAIERMRRGEIRFQNLLLDCFCPTFWYAGRALTYVKKEDVLRIQASSSGTTPG